jgi:GT2 family glycosyltransferase
MFNVSVIILNYNGRTLLEECMRSLYSQSFSSFQIIIVDNGSTDGSVEEIKRYLNNGMNVPSVKPVYLPYNSGFAEGNIEGIRCADGKYIALLNNDTEVHEQWLQELMRVMDNHKDVGICASKLIVHNKEIIDSAGDGFARSLQGHKRGEGDDSNEFSKQEYVFGACAGAALYRREMLEDVGSFDEDFFLIHEDTDLNFRAQLAGWKVLYVPTAIVYHKVRSSIVDMSDIAVYYTIRNRDFVRIKNVPCLVIVKCLPEFITGIVAEFFYFVVRHGKIRLYCRAKYDVLKNFKKMMIKRRSIMRKRRVRNQYIYHLMTPIWKRDLIKRKLKKIIYG